MTRLPWRRTFGDPNDGHVKAADLLDRLDNMRAYRINGGPQDGRWYWTASRFTKHGDGVIRPRTVDGYEETKEAAQEAAERAYFGEEKAHDD